MQAHVGPTSNNLMSKGMGKANISRNPTTAFLQVVWSGHTEQPEDEGAAKLQ